MVNERLRSQIIETVENRINSNNPKCTKETYERLRELGYSDQDAKKAIGQVLIKEMYGILKNQVPFNEEKYCKALSKLPESIS